MRNGMFKYAVLFSLILLASSAFAANDDLENIPDLFCVPGGKSGNNPAFGGKPVSLLSGMETFAPSTDLTIGTVFPIRVTRSYNSRTTYISPLGYGWAINYDKRLYTYADYSITVRRECGGKKRFTWLSPVVDEHYRYQGQSGDAGSLVGDMDGSYTYTDKYGESEKYDSQGRLISMSDTKGNSLVFTYHSELREFLKGILPFSLDQDSPTIVANDYHLSRIAEVSSNGTTTALTGIFVDFKYEDATTGRLTSISDNIGRVVTYTWFSDNSGNLKSVSGPNGTSTYDYTDANNKHLLTSIDEGQGAYENSYYPDGKVKTQKHGAGLITFDYQVPYVKTVMTTEIWDTSDNHLTQTRTVEFDANGMVEKVTDTYGNSTTYVRDENTRVLYEAATEYATNMTITTAYTYDDKGNVETKTEAQGSNLERTTYYTYHPYYNLVATETVSSVVDPAQDSVTTNTYDDANGNLLSTIKTGLPDIVSATSYTYYPSGRIQSVTNPRSVVTYYTYQNTDGTGYLQSIKQGYNSSTPLTTTYADWDDFGNPRKVTDPNSQVTTYEYYPDNGRVKSVKAPGDATATTYFYSDCASCGAGRLAWIQLPEGNTIRYHYDDGMGNLTSIRDDAGNSVIYTYDSEGNKLTEKIRDPANALQKILTYQYDKLNRLTKIVNPDQTYTQYEYDSRGNRTSIQNPKTKVTAFLYDVRGRLASVTQPGNVVTTYAYNGNNNLKSVKDAENNTTTYKYDDSGRVYRVISRDTGTTTYSYDPAGNLLTKKDAKGKIIGYTYDDLDRLTKIDFPNNADIVYTYDVCLNGAGRLCSMTDHSGSTAYVYSPKGQVITETKTITGIAGNYITRYTYDKNGNVKTMTYPSSREITYTYENDKVVSVQNGAAYLASNITYKPFGGLSGLTYGNGLAGTIGYDTQYRITSITAGAIMSLGYDEYDANANIKHITNALDGNKSFDYDDLDRLTGGMGQSWTYDRVGNRQTEGSTVYSYIQGTNKLSGVGGLTYSYDENGNTTADGLRGYTYDENQRLIAAGNGSYTYNGNGQRVKKVVGAATTIYHYSQTGQLIAESNESNSAGTFAAEYVYLNGQPLAKLEGVSTYYYHNDHLGTPQKMTNSSGTVVWSADYKPFGEASITVIDNFTNNLRFPGQYYDAETGLNYNYFRDYNPTVGRYIQADPRYQADGPNVYLYVHNLPLRLVDPRGLAAAGTTTDCSYYDDAYNQTGCAYYKTVKKYCLRFGRLDNSSTSLFGMFGAGWTQCVRRCLQIKDAEKCRPNANRSNSCVDCSNVSKCNGDNHQYCYSSCRNINQSSGDPNASPPPSPNPDWVDNKINGWSGDIVNWVMF